MIQFSKGAWFWVGLVAGIALGISDAGPEISKAWSQLRGASSTFMDTAGQGASNAGRFVEE